MNKNSKNKRIFEVLWTVDAVLRLLESTLLHFKVDKMNWGVIFQGRIYDFSAGRAEGGGEARVVKASSKGAKPRAGVWGGIPQNILKS
jgi:hypothetical protein